MPPNSNDRLRTLRSLGIPRHSKATPNPGGRRTGQPRARPLVSGTLIFAVGITLGVAGERWRQPANMQHSDLPSTALPDRMSPATHPAPAVQWQVAGYLVARRQAIVGSEVTAKVDEVMVHEGDRVARGQVMARLIDATARKDLVIASSRASAAQANVQAIFTQLAKAKRDRDRARLLAPYQAISTTALDNAEAMHNRLQAELAQAQALKEAALLVAERAELVLAQHVVKAPFPGVVANCMAQPGEMISPISTLGTPTRIGICSVIDIDTLEIEVDVAESYITRLRLGMPATAVVDALAQSTFSARVSAILPAANRERSTVRVRLSIFPTSTHLRPEMAVKVSFDMPKAPLNPMPAEQE